LFAKAYGNRGLARLSQGDVAAAKKDFDACIGLDPKLKRALQEQIEQTKACSQALMNEQS